MPIMRSGAAGLIGHSAPHRQPAIRNHHKVHSRNTEDASSAAYRQKVTDGNASNSSSSSIASYGSEVMCKVTFKLSGKADSSNVFYKDDEDRFRQRHTLKLKTSTDYNVLMEIEPAQELLYLRIAGKEYTTFETKNDPEIEKKRVCEFVWSTENIEPTIRFHRTVIPWVMKFKPYKEVEFQLQAKFYRSEEMYHYKGYPLSSVDMTCKAGRGTFQSNLESLRLV